mgnify:CR=1 FL=1
MRKIHFVGNHYSYFEFYHPVRLFRKALKERGFDVHYFFNILAKGIEDCDVLVFQEDNYRQLLPIQNKDRQSTVDFLRNYFSRFARVIWFDSNDSSGWLRSYVFPLVDVYAKSQVLKNLEYYQQNHVTGILHRDYVIEKFGVEDNKTAKAPISEKDSHKIRVAWRRAYRDPIKFHRLPIFRHFPPRMPAYQTTQPNLKTRSKLIQYRVRTWKNHPTINCWREQTKKQLLQVMKKHPDYRLITSGHIPLNKYLSELENCPVTISPFGLNEFCLRDIWAFVSGSLLFKPSLDHVISFPDYYLDGETYVSHAWDFSDFEEKLDDILSHPQLYEGIAREGQEQFIKVIQDGAGFARQFDRMVS